MSTQVFDGKKVVLDTEYPDLAAAELTEIWYEKPNTKTTGRWPAQIDGTKLFYQCQPGDINEIGDWNVQVHFEVDGLPFTGEMEVMPVNRIIEVPPLS